VRGDRETPNLILWDLLGSSRARSKFDNLEVCADVAIKFVVVSLREDVAVEIQSDCCEVLNVLRRPSISRQKIVRFGPSRMSINYRRSSTDNGGLGRGKNDASAAVSGNTFVRGGDDVF